MSLDSFSASYFVRYNCSLFINYLLFYCLFGLYVQHLQNFIHISVFISNISKFTAGNIVCSWGRGEDGQLGHGDAEDRLSPTKLSALDGHEIVSVTCGADHTIAFSDKHMEVYSWGWSVLISLFFRNFIC